jgi:hypothetical protein
MEAAEVVEATSEQWWVYGELKGAADIPPTLELVEDKSIDLPENEVEAPATLNPASPTLTVALHTPTHESSLLNPQQLVLGITTVASLAFSVACAIWLIRSGSPLAGLMPAAPATFDPLSFVELGDPREEKSGRSG